MTKMRLDVHNYEQYVTLCEALDVKPLTFEEIYEHVDDVVIVDHLNEINDKVNNLGNAGKFIAGGFNKIWNNPGIQNSAKRMANDALNVGKDFIRGMSFGAGHNAIMDIVDMAAFEASKFISGGGGGGNNGSGGSGGSGNNYHSSGSAQNSLQFKGNPLELKLDTGIINRVWTSNVLSPSDEFTPMHMTSIKLSFQQLVEDGNVRNYFNKAFYTKLLNVAQSKVNFSVASLDAFSDVNIMKYVDALINGLNVYFFYISIICFFENPMNNNYAMTDLRNRITPEIMNELTILQRQLTAYPIPPKLMNFLYYLNGNFKANHLDGSAIIKFDTVTFTDEEVKKATSSLKDMEKTASLLSRIFPEWLAQDLPTYPGTCFHDYMFNTIWTNAPYEQTTNVGTVYGPFIINSDDRSIAYQTYTSELDGAAFALTSIHDGTGMSGFQPGFVKPKRSCVMPTGPETLTASRVSFDTNGWVNSAFSTNDALDRNDTYPACAIGNQDLIKPSINSQCEPVKSVNKNTIRQAHFDFIDFMASFDSASSSNYSSEGKGKARRRRK